MDVWSTMASAGRETGSNVTDFVSGSLDKGGAVPVLSGTRFDVLGQLFAENQGM